MVFVAVHILEIEHQHRFWDFYIRCEFHKRCPFYKWYFRVQVTVNLVLLVKLHAQINELSPSCSRFLCL